MSHIFIVIAYHISPVGSHVKDQILAFFSNVSNVWIENLGFYHCQTSKVSTVIIRNSNISEGWAEKRGGMKFWSISKANSGVLKSYHNINILNILNSTFSNNVVSETIALC